MIYSKGQSGVEFLIIVGAIMIFSTIFLITLYENMSDEIKERRTNSLNEVALTIQDEVAIATKASEGYSRTFKLPENLLNGIQYEIQKIDNLVYLKTSDEKTALSISILNVTGEFNPGDNIIKKENGTVFVN